MLSGSNDDQKNPDAGEATGLAVYLSESKRLIELVIFAFTAPLIGYLLFPSDPLGIQAGFPWAAVGPIVFAARYGVGWGVSCALAAVLAIFYPHAAYQTEPMLALTVTLAVGTVILAVVVGDANSRWRKRSGSASAENIYLRHRLKEFSNDYHVLKVSHGQLEEYMAGQKLSLRQAMQQLKPVLDTRKDGLEAGAELMAIFSQFCSLQVAGLYSMKNEDLVNPNPVATHGDMGDLPIFDKLLKLAISKRKVISIKLDSLAADKHQNDLLAVVPIVDSSKKIHGVLAIRDMHFMAFQQENLNLLSLLGGYVGDMLSRSKGHADSQGAWFMAELDTALRFARTNSVETSLIALKLKRFDGEQKIAQHISANLRSLDASWKLQSQDGAQTVMILLPLINRKQAEGYLFRMIENVSKKFQIDLDKATNSCRVLQIERGVTREDCLAFMQNKSKGKLKRGAASKEVYNRITNDSVENPAVDSVVKKVDPTQAAQDKDAGESSGEKAA